MNTIVSWIDFWNRRVRLFSIWDLKLAQVWTAAWLLVLVKLFPQIMEISIWWFVAIIVLCVPRLFHLVFIKRPGSD